MSSGASSTALRLAIATLALLPFEWVAKVSLVVSAAIFIAQTFASARLYALAAVAVIFVLAKAHRAWEAGRWQPAAALRYRVVYHEVDGRTSNREFLLSPTSAAAEAIDAVLNARGAVHDARANTTLASGRGEVLHATDAGILADLEPAEYWSAPRAVGSTGPCVHVFVGREPPPDWRTS